MHVVGESPRWPSGQGVRLESGRSRVGIPLEPGRVIPVISKLALQWLPCQAPGIIGSALGLVGPVSVYCDLGDVESWICIFYLSVAARKIVCADPSLRY